MESRSHSQCGDLTGWSVFKNQQSGELHVIGFSASYGFDVITQALKKYEYDKKSKAGRAVTKSGVLYQLSGRPLFFSPSGHPQLKAFTQQHSCNIQFVRSHPRPQQSPNN